MVGWNSYEWLDRIYYLVFWGVVEVWGIIDGGDLNGGRFGFLGRGNGLLVVYWWYGGGVGWGFL